MQEPGTPAADVHVEDVGNGPTLLCLHGIGSSSASFRAQIDHFRASRRVLAWDAPGYAQSPDAPAAPGMSGYADAVAALLRARDAAPADVLGVSFGGVVAIVLALRHPDLVRSLILADASFGSGAVPSSVEAMRQRGPELERLGPEEFAARRAPRLLSADAPAQLVDEVRRNMAASIRLPGYAHAAEAMAETDLTDRVSDVQVPTLVVCGQEDTVTGPDVSRALADRIPGARLALIDGAGHLSNQEASEQFNATVEQFLDGLGERPTNTPTAIGRRSKM